MATPEVSVIMPVYNAERYVRQAIVSILGQTLINFEFIIINDGSTDQSLSIIRKFSDPRIRVINKTQSGLVHALNVGITESKGTYIARMDADDISLPDRLEKEYNFLEKNLTYGIVGTTFVVLNENRGIVGVNATLLEDDDLKKEVIVETIFGHGTVMMRRSILDVVGLYNPKSLHVEDFELWIRFSKVAKMANLSDILYIWRDNICGVSHMKQDVQSKNSRQLQRGQLDELKQLCNEKIVDLKKIYSYPTEIIFYEGKRYIVRRSDRLSHVYFSLAYRAFMSGNIVLTLQALLMSFLISPFHLFRRRQW